MMFEIKIFAPHQNPWELFWGVRSSSGGGYQIHIQIALLLSSQ